MSRTSRCWQIALDPTRSRAGRPSSTTTGISQRARRRAAVWPTGPFPRTSTGWCCFMVCVPSGLEEVPHLAVALGGPNEGPVDAGELVPQPGNVEGQAVLEDRPVPELGCQRRVGRLERLLEGATALL